MNKKDFNDDNINDLSIDEITELYEDIIEMPEPLIATICGCGAKVIAGSFR